MKLEIYSQPTQRRAHSGDPIINMTRSGKLSPSKSLASALGIKNNSTMLVAKDTDSKNDWYIAIGDENAEGFKMRLQKNGFVVGHGCREANGKILDSIKVKISASFIVAVGKPQEIDGTKWYRIITSNPTYTK